VSFYFAMRSAPQILINKAMALTITATALFSLTAWLLGLLLNRYLAVAAGAGLAVGFILFFLRSHQGLLTTKSQKLPPDEAS
jgi:hypothetical protein